MKITTYANNEVNTANRLQLLIMLYDSAVRFMNLAKDAISSENLAQRGVYISKAMAIISEFKSTLDHRPNPELAANLDRLYNFINSRLLQANLRNDPVLIDEALKITNILREAWVELSNKASTENASLGNAVRQVNQNSLLNISV